MGEPLSNQEGQKRAREILNSGTVFFAPHAQKAMADDGLTTVDVENVLRAGWVEMSEYENGEWRYRVRTNRIAVIVAFESETELTVVTVWRF
jgi:uncharacterized protein DUF4258